MALRYLYALFLFGLMAKSAYAVSPYLFTPTGGDDANALREALIAHRWVQINGADVRIDTPIQLQTDAGVPLHNILLEPARGINQTTIHTAIAQDPANPTNPSKAPFTYNGGFEPGSFLTAAVPAGVMSITVRDPALLWWVTSSDVRRPQAFQVGQYAYLNDTSRVADVKAGYVKQVQTGAAEVRKILAIEPSGSPGELRLYLESPLRRPHQATISVSHCEPIRNAVIRNLRFTSDSRPGPRAGIHLHMAFNAEISNVTSMNWRGFSLILLNSGGRKNIIKSSYAAGVNVPGDYPNGWGIAAQGQEDTVILDSGAERHMTGIVINFSINTFALNSSVQGISHVSLSVAPDAGGNPSMSSGFIGGRVYGGGLGAYIGTKCVGCVVDIKLDYPYSGVKVAPGAYNTRVMGSIMGAGQYGVGIDASSDGSVSSRGTLLNASARCSNTKLVLLNGTHVSPHTPSASDSYYTLGPLFSVCP